MMSRFIALFVGNPLNGGTEPTYADYARQPVADDIHLERPRGRGRFESVEVDFPRVAAEAEYQQTITHVAILDANSNVVESDAAAKALSLSDGIRPELYPYRIIKPH